MSGKLIQSDRSPWIAVALALAAYVGTDILTGNVWASLTAALLTGIVASEIRRAIAGFRPFSDLTTWKVIPLLRLLTFSLFMLLVEP